MTSIHYQESNAPPGYQNNHGRNSPGFQNNHGRNSPEFQNYHGSNAPPGFQNYYGNYNYVPPGYKISDVQHHSIASTVISLLAFIGWITYTCGVALLLPRIRKFLGVGPIPFQFQNLLPNDEEMVYRIVYYIFIIISFNLVAFIPSLASYRLLVIAFLTVGFKYLTADMILCIPLVVSVNHGFIPISYLNRYFGDSTAFSSELNAALGGTIMLIMAWIGMIVSLSRSAST